MIEYPEKQMAKKFRTLGLAAGLTFVVCTGIGLGTALETLEQQEPSYKVSIAPAPAPCRDCGCSREDRSESCEVSRHGD